MADSKQEKCAVCGRTGQGFYEVCDGSIAPIDRLCLWCNEDVELVSLLRDPEDVCPLCSVNKLLPKPTIRPKKNAFANLVSSGMGIKLAAKAAAARRRSIARKEQDMKAKVAIIQQNTDLMLIDFPDPAAWRPKEAAPLYRFCETYRPKGTVKKSRMAMVTAIADIFEKKMIADAIDDAQEGGTRQTIQEFVLDYVQNLYGLRSLAFAHLHALMRATLKYANRCPRARLFGMLCGVLSAEHYTFAACDMIMRVFQTLIPDVRAFKERYADERTCAIGKLEAQRTLQDLFKTDKTWQFVVIQPILFSKGVRQPWTSDRRSQLESAIDAMHFGSELPEAWVHMDDFVWALLDAWVAERSELQTLLDVALEEQFKVREKAAAGVISKWELRRRMNTHAPPVQFDLSPQERVQLTTGVQLFGHDWKSILRGFTWTTKRSAGELERWWRIMQLAEKAATATEMDWLAWQWEPDWEWGGLQIGREDGMSVLQPDEIIPPHGLIDSCKQAGSHGFWNSRTSEPPQVVAVRRRSEQRRESNSSTSADAKFLEYRRHMKHRLSINIRRRFARFKFRMLAGHTNPTAGPALDASPAHTHDRHTESPTIGFGEHVDSDTLLKLLSPPVKLSNSVSTPELRVTQTRDTRRAAKLDASWLSPHTKSVGAPEFTLPTGPDDLERFVAPEHGHSARSGRQDTSRLDTGRLSTGRLSTGRLDSARPETARSTSPVLASAPQSPETSPRRSPRQRGIIHLSHFATGDATVKALASVMSRSTKLPELPIDDDATTLAGEEMTASEPPAVAEPGVMTLTKFQPGSSNVTDIQVIQLADNGLTSRGCQILAQAIAGSQSLTTLILSDNRIGAAGAAALAGAAMDPGCRWLTLELRNAKLGNDGAKCLVKSLSHVKTLIALDIADNGVTEGKKLAALLRGCPGLHRLCLSWNSFRGPEGVGIVEALWSLRQLRQVQLAFCSLNDAAGESLGRLIGRHAALQLVDISYNASLGMATATSLQHGLGHTETLEDLVVTGSLTGDSRRLLEKASAALAAKGKQVRIQFD